ncbi:unnamed protein product, partial [Cylicostephanus goldi]
KLPPNVYTFEWIPQSDLLHHFKIKAFITHGGYNSLQGNAKLYRCALTESNLGDNISRMVMPLGGDQPRNARLAERHHFAVRIHKNDVCADKVAEALGKVLDDQRFVYFWPLLRMK